MSTFRHALLTTALAFAGFAPQTALARSGFSIATGAMALTNATKQGGQGAEGSTVLTQTDLSWHDGWYGAGLFVQYDKQGSNETDVAAGPRLELTFDPFYVELGYAAKLNRSFVDRAIAEQTGSGYHLTLGARFAIGGGTADSGAFLFGAYKYRIQSVTHQDEAELDEPITQTDGYPLFGLGVGF